MLYSIEEIKKEFEEGSVQKALFKLRLLSFDYKLDFSFKWATLELYGYTELLNEMDDSLPWWRDCCVVWIDKNNKHVGTDYDPERDQVWVLNGVKDIEEQRKDKLPKGEFRILPPDGKQDTLQYGLVEMAPLFNHIREAGLHLLSDIDAVIQKRENHPNAKSKSALEEVVDFRNHIERQAHKDIFVNGKPQENIARALLETFLVRRSYREVPVRGGKTDIIVFDKEGRHLYETKIWRGKEYYEQGFRELEEYILGENDDGNLKSAFYLIFDPTKTNSAAKYNKGEISFRKIANFEVTNIVVNIAPPLPSKKTRN